MPRRLVLFCLFLCLLGACGGARAEDLGVGGASPVTGAIDQEPSRRRPEDCGPPSAIPPPDEWLTCVTGAAIQQRTPWSHVFLSGVRELRIVVDEADPVEVYLDNLAARAAQVGTADEAMAVIVEFAGRIVATLDESVMTVAPEQIRVVLKPAGWADEIAAQDGAPGTILAAPFTETIEAVFVVDLSTSMRMLTEHERARLGIERDALPALALGNMEAALTALPFARHPEESALFVLIAGDAYDASRVLLPALWSEARRAVEGTLLVAVPSRDVVLFTGSEAPGGFEALRALADRIAREDAYPISPAILQWTDHGFVMLPAVGTLTGRAPTIEPVPPGGRVLGQLTSPPNDASAQRPPAAAAPSPESRFRLPSLTRREPPLLPRGGAPIARDLETGYRLALATERVQFPVGPISPTLEATTIWTNGRLRPWLAERLAAVRAAESVLNRIAERRASTAELALAAATCGWMYEDLVRRFLGIPIPELLARDAEPFEVYGQAILDQVQPLAETARQRFLYCAQVSPYCTEGVARIEAAFPPGAR